MDKIKFYAKRLLETDEYAHPRWSCDTPILYRRLAEEGLYALERGKPLAEIAKILHQIEEKICGVEIDFNENKDRYDTWTNVIGI